MDSLTDNTNFIKEHLALNSTKNFCVISDNIFLKDYTTYKVLSPEDFSEFVLKKIALLSTPNIISKSESIFVIRNITKNLFLKNSALSNLTKSNLFANDLYNLFGLFYEYNLSTEQLFQIVNSANIETEDKNRFEIIIKAYEKYDSILNLKNFIDRRNISNYTCKLITNSPNYLKYLKKSNFENIILDESTYVPNNIQNLLNLLELNLVKRNFIQKYGNNAANTLAEKYLDKTIISDKKSETKFFKFNDITDEAEFICNTIINKVKSENYNFSDFAIALNQQTTGKVFQEYLSLANIPTNTIQPDNIYQSFLVKLSQYINICDIYTKLKSEKSLTTTRKDELYEELNLNFENIISETLENQFAKDKFLSMLNYSTTLSLIDCVKNNLNLLTVEDAVKINTELNQLDILIELYSKKNIIQLITIVANNFKIQSPIFKTKLAKLIKEIRNLENLNTTFGHPILNYSDILEIINKPQQINNPNQNRVTIGSFKEIAKSEFKEIFFPNLTEKTTPKFNNSIQFISEEANTKISAEIKKLVNNFEQIIPTQSFVLIDTAKNFIQAICSAKNTVILSTHNYEDKKQTIPSIYYQFLSTILSDEEEDTKIEFKTIKPEHKQISLDLTIENNKIIIEDKDTLKLSASAISTFQSCPKKYYFAHLLGLKGQSTFAATYGTIVHAIMEIFNQKYITSYSAETLLNLTDILFKAAETPKAAIAEGFTQRIIDLISATNLLSLTEMKDNFKSAIKEMEKNGFFNQIPDEIISEKSFEFEIAECPNVVFDGRIDAIYRFGDNYTVVDYKTGKNKPELSYLISNNGVNFRTSKGPATNLEAKQNEFEYQIPIYFFATQFAEEFKNLKNSIKSLGLLYIRPQNKHNGFKQDFVSTEILNEFTPNLIENLNNTVINRIRNCKSFSACKNSMICDNCEFKLLCDSNSEEAEND